MIKSSFTKTHCVRSLVLDNSLDADIRSPRMIMASTNGSTDIVMDDVQPSPLTGKRKRATENEEEARSMDTSTGNASGGSPSAFHELCSDILKILLPYVSSKATCSPPY